MKKEYKIETDCKGVHLNVSDLAMLHSYYEAACTGEFIHENCIVCPERALQLGSEVRDAMDMYDSSEEDEVYNIRQKYHLAYDPAISDDILPMLDDFQCNIEPAKCSDSMLFDSDTTIATLQASNDDYEISVNLMVRGYVRVEYRGNVYTSPSDFPEELRDYISWHPGTWSMEAPDGDVPTGEKRSIYVADANWFEYIVDIHVLSTGERWSDGIMFESDLTEYNPTELCEEMANDILAQVVGNLS